MFASDAARFNKFSVSFEDILLDYSKNRITSETMALLTDLARESGVEARRGASMRRACLCCVGVLTIRCRCHV